MKPTEEGLMQNSICIVSFSLRLMAVIVCMSTYIAANAQLKKAPIAKSIYYGIPANYAQVGGTDLYYYQTSSAIDIIGKFGDNYYSSTYSNGGYKLAMQVGNSYPAYVDCLYGTTIDGVTCTVSIAEQGELAKICYTVVNNNDTAVNVSLGTHADVMIGNNDIGNMAFQCIVYRDIVLASGFHAYILTVVLDKPISKLNQLVIEG